MKTERQIQEKLKYIKQQVSKYKYEENNILFLRWLKLEKFCEWVLER